jgi:hypothetical protein
MIKIEFCLAELTQPEATALMAMLKSHDSNTRLTVGKSEDVSSPVEEEELYRRDATFEMALPVDVTPVEEVKTRKPRTKKETSVVEVEPEPEAPTEEPTAPEGFELPTIEVLREALRNYTVKNGMSAGIALLKQFERTKVSEIQEMTAEEQAKFMVEANA